MDRTTQCRIQRLAGLLAAEKTYEPGDLLANENLTARVLHALAEAPSDHPLEGELHDLLTRMVEAPDTVETYDLDRAIAEADGVVPPGGAIEYQYRWRAPDGDWSPWITWRTRDDMDVPVPKPAGDAKFRVAAAPAKPPTVRAVGPIQAVSRG